MAEDAHVIAQRLRSRHGRAFEDIVARILNRFLVADQLVVIRGMEGTLAAAIGDTEAARELVNFTKLPVKRRCSQTQIEDYPDSDLFVVVVPSGPDQRYRLMAIINCKVSFHARHTETCFWGSAVRASSYIKYVCVTEDRDIYQRKRSELGVSCERPRAVRRLLECFTDRLYIIKKYAAPDAAELDRDIKTKETSAASARGLITFDNPSQPHHTQYCHLVRPFDDLIDDLRYWKRDVPR